MSMEAPIYPPATAYEAPKLQPYVLSADGCAIAELKSDPAAWAIILKHMPAIKFLVEIPDTQKLLSNMTIVDFGVFSNPIDPKILATMNAELAQLPGSKRGL
jgi:hypothetical protein